MIDYFEALEFAAKIAREKGQYLLGNWNNIGDLTYHTNIDFSTSYDMQIEDEIYSQLVQRYPNHGFYGEERQNRRDDELDFVWHVDPIDGTKYFARQVPLFTTAIGLTYKDRPVLGVVYNPSSDQMYSGAEGIGSFINGQRIEINHREELLRNAIIGLEIGNEDKRWETNIINQFLIRAGRVRIFGNATLSLCWVLQGALQAYVDLFGMKQNGKWQDLVAPLAIAENAGLVVRDILTEIGQTKVVCSHATLFAEISEIVSVDIS